MFAEFIHTVSFAFSVTGPIFLIVLFGIVLRFYHVLDEGFIYGASKITFNVAIPALLFGNISKTDLLAELNLFLLVFSGVATLLVFVFLSVVALFWISDPRERGVFVQGSLRANVGVVGLAMCASTYGPSGLLAASVLMAVLVILYNILSLYTLHHSLAGGQGSVLRETCKSLISNPIILSILCALPIAYWHIKLPSVAMVTIDYFSQMALPLALLCIGGALSLKGFVGSLYIPILTMVLKLIIIPIAITGCAYALGIRGMDLGVLFMLVGSPTATVSFIMVQELGGNAQLAANIVVLTTLCSLLTLSFGLVFLRGFGFI